MKNTGRRVAVIVGVVLSIDISILAIAGTRREIRGSIAGVQADINACDYQASEETITNLNTEISALEAQLAQAQKDLAEAEANNDALGVLRAKTVVESCTRELTQKRKALRESILQRDNSLYYVQNREALVAKEQEQAAYQSYCSELQMRLCDEKISYLSTLSKELEKKIEIENEKLKRGYAIQLSVDEVVTEFENVQIQIEDAQAEREFHRENMSQISGESGTSLENGIEKLSADYAGAFFSHSMQLKYYDSQIAAYTSYIDSAGEENTDKIKKQRELAELSRQEYQKELELYVKEKQQNHEKLRNRVRELDNEKKLTQKKADHQRILLKKGRALEIEVKELETELSRLEYERKSCIADAMSIRYLLEHCVEGET